jgi:flagellar basal-body rod protein FlgB
LDEISAAILKKSLDGLSMRYAFIAQNVANVNSPDYQPVRVSFEEALRAAAASGAEAVVRVEPSAHVVAPSANSESVRLDLELADASQTAGRYRALLDMLSRQMALHRAVINEGGR